MSTEPTPTEAADLVRKRWSDCGGCLSCGWKPALYEYGYLERALRINSDKGRIELPCLNYDEDSAGHRGIRIYYEVRRP